MFLALGRTVSIRVREARMLWPPFKLVVLFIQVALTAVALCLVPSRSPRTMYTRCSACRRWWHYWLRSQIAVQISFSRGEFRRRRHFSIAQPQTRSRSISRFGRFADFGAIRSGGFGRAERLLRLPPLQWYRGSPVASRIVFGRWRRR